MNQELKSKHETKQTELGELPVDWEIVRLSDLAEIKYGKANPNDRGKYPVIGSGGIYSSTSTPLTKYSTIVVGRKGTAGKAWLMLAPCYPSDTTFYLEWKRDVDINYVYGQILLNPLSGKHAKTTLPSLQKPDLENFKIPLPPLQEQQKIAYVLSAIQDDKEKTEYIINSYKELKKSLMKHLFKYGPVKFEDADKVKLKKTEVGEIPENWEVKEIKDLIEKTKQKDMRKENIEFKYVDVSSIDRNFYKIVGFTLHKGKTSPSRARKIVKTNDVIVATVRPTLKRIALVSEDYDNQICSTAFCVLRANKEQLNPKFLYYSSQRPLFFDALASIQRGASYPAVTDSDIKKQKIAYPPPACQEEIVELLSSVDSKISQEENKKKALEELFKSMLSHLMTAKIRVKDIEVQNGKG